MEATFYQNVRNASLHSEGFLSFKLLVDYTVALGKHGEVSMYARAHTHSTENKNKFYLIVTLWAKWCCNKCNVEFCRRHINRSEKITFIGRHKK